MVHSCFSKRPKIDIYNIFTNFTNHDRLRFCTVEHSRGLCLPEPNGLEKAIDIRYIDLPRPGSATRIQPESVGSASYSNISPNLLMGILTNLAPGMIKYTFLQSG